MPVRAQEEITGLLLAWRDGDCDALTALMPLVYERLKDIAGHLLKRERRNGQPDTTALVHEAYLRLADLDRLSWKDRAHFFAMSARLMRQVLVDRARYLQRAKRGGGEIPISLDDMQNGAQAADTIGPEIVALEEGLTALKARDPQRAEIVELRFFGGLDRREIAEVTGLSTATVTRRWRSARAWLLDYLEAGEGAGADGDIAIR